MTRSFKMVRLFRVAGTLALTLTSGLFCAEVTVANADRPGPVAVIQRSGTVDVPLSMDPRPLQPLIMTAVNGTRMFKTEHQGTFNGKRVRYLAELAETIIQKPAGKPAASMITTSYIAQKVDRDPVDAAKRPVVFIFNGGPGGSAVFLHFTSLGPKRLRSIKAADFVSETNVLIDNPESVLDAADLVFVDPIDTGFGRSMPGAGDEFRSVDSDSEAMSQFVINWLRTHDRLSSPKYVLGESYGTLRAVAMARDLARSDAKVVLDGVILCGQAITFAQNGRVPNPIFIASDLPMMASVAWHYGKIDNKSQTWGEAVQKARVFAYDEYLPALVRGYRLDQAAFDRIVQRLPELIGIPESYFRTGRTIAVADFNSELLRDRGLVLDRNNGLETRPAPPPDAERSKTEDQSLVKQPADKPADKPYPYTAFSTNMERYATKELAASGLGTYEPTTPPREGAKPWDFITTGASALDVTLASVLREHAKMRVLVLQGRHDTLTDLGATEYVMSQTDLPHDRYSIVYYDGGHMLAPEPEALNPLRSFMSNPIQ
jgi:carboxypeptidase C (cathepsin A)